MIQFFGNCSLDSVDFITTHKYGCNVTATLTYINDLLELYGKPIWLTEFSCSEAGAPKQLAFQQDILPKMDNLAVDVLERYAWFATRTDGNSAQTNAALMSKLTSSSPGDLTALGLYYNGTESMSDSLMS